MYETRDLYSSDSERSFDLEELRTRTPRPKRHRDPVFWCPMCEEDISLALLVTHIPACYCWYIREKCKLMQAPFCICVACDGQQSHTLCQNCIQNGRNTRQIAVALTGQSPTSPAAGTRSTSRVSPVHESRTSLMASTWNRRTNQEPGIVPLSSNNTNSFDDVMTDRSNLLDQTSSRLSANSVQSPTESNTFSRPTSTVEPNNSSPSTTSDQTRNVFSAPGGTDNLPPRQALMTIYTNTAGGVISSQPRATVMSAINYDSFTNKQHRGVHCILCHKSNDKISKTTPMIRVGKYRGYLVCKKSHFSEVFDEKKLVETLTALHNLPESPTEIPLNKIPAPLQAQWRAPCPNVSEGTTCNGYLDVLPNPTLCSNRVPLNSIPIWLNDLSHDMTVRQFCSIYCVVFFLKNKYPGNRKGRKPKS